VEVGQLPAEAPCDPAEPLDSTPEKSRQLPDKGHLFNALLTAMVIAGQGVFLLCDIFGLTRTALGVHVARLGLPAPHERPGRNTRRAWSVPDVVRLIIWRMAGVHPEVIGAKLGTPRSANAVRAKARRLGIVPPPRKMLHRPASLADPGGDGLKSLVPALSLLPVPVPGDEEEAAGWVPRKRGRPRKIRPAPSVPEKLPPEKRASGRKRARSVQAPSAATGVPVVAAGMESLPARAPNTASTGSENLVSSKVSFAGASVAPGWSKDRLPRHEREIDLCDLRGDLTWFRHLNQCGKIGRTGRLHNRVAVWLAAVMIAGGLRFDAAAARLGVTPNSFRTFRTNAGIPRIGRKQMGTVFDPAAALEVIAQSDFEIRECLRTGKFFWAARRDKGDRLSPTLKAGERPIGVEPQRWTLTKKIPLIRISPRETGGIDDMEKGRCVTPLPPFRGGYPIPTFRGGWSSAA
jgi:hypothetical protein